MNSSHMSHSTHVNRVWLQHPRASHWWHFKMNPAQGFFSQHKRTQVVTSWATGDRAKVGLKATGSRKDTPKMLPRVATDGAGRGKSRKHLQRKVSFQTPARSRGHDTHLWQWWSCRKYRCSVNFISKLPSLNWWKRKETPSPLLGSGFSWRQNWALSLNQVRTL